MAKSITEEELNEIHCYDISIQTLPDGKDLLILICETKEGSTKLIELLHQNPFDLKVSIEAGGNYSLVCDFIYSDIVFKLETDRNDKNYPPLKKLRDNRIRFITTGIWTGKSAQGRTCEYSTQLMRLGELDIAGSFKQALEVQFAAGKLGVEPSVVALIFNDYNHIFEAEADEAYNELIKLTKGKPTLEILQNDSIVSLKIWDILIDLEVKLDRLKYSQNELTTFLKETGQDDSFAFVLGFRPKDGEKAAIASTKKGSPEIITIRGYTHRKE